MKILVKTKEFDLWLLKLKDNRAKAKILFRLQKVGSHGHYGDFKIIHGGLREMRINYAKGYRIYYRELSTDRIILLIGGDKSSQKRDILKAKKIWSKLNHY